MITPKKCWKYETTNVLCPSCDLFMVYHKRTNRFYCGGCHVQVQILDPATSRAQRNYIYVKEEKRA